MPKPDSPAMLALAAYKKSLKGKKPKDTVVIFLAGFKRGVEWAMQPPENDKEPAPAAAPEKNDDDPVDADQSPPREPPTLVVGVSGVRPCLAAQEQPVVQGRRGLNFRRRAAV